MSDADTTDELTDAEKEAMCERCGGCCCSFRGLNISYGTYEDQSFASYLREQVDFPEVDGEITRAWELVRQDKRVPDMTWYDTGETLLFECNHLTDDGKCGIYEDRPAMCQRFECDALRGEMELQDFLATYARDPGEIDMAELEDVTDEVTSIICGLPDRDP